MPRKPREIEQESLEKEDAEKEQQEQPGELTFRLERLREFSQDLFGVPVEIFDGAMHGANQSKATKSEVKKRIDDFLSREV